MDIIKDNLPNYIKWKDYEINASLLSDTSPLNIQVKTYIIDYLAEHNERFNNVSVAISEIDDMDNIFFGDDNYIKIVENGQAGMIIREKIHDEQYSYRKLLEYVNYEKINNMITNTHTLPKGVNGEICRIIDIIQMDETKYNNYIDELETYLTTLVDVYYHTLKREIDKIKNIRNKFSKCQNSDYNNMYNNVFDQYVIEKQKIYNKKNDAAKKTCIITDTFKHPEKYNLQIGQTFNSCNELAVYTNKDNHTISRWRNNGWII